LADTLPPQYTPRSKHNHIKTIWFRELIKKLKIKLVKIETVEQLGDLFTKALPRVQFEYGRISWVSSIKFPLERECWRTPILVGRTPILPARSFLLAQKQVVGSLLSLAIYF
jgi:hypothetical protein